MLKSIAFTGLLAFLLAMPLACSQPEVMAQSETPPAPSDRPSTFMGWRLPAQITLCGENMPLDDLLVRENMDQQLIIAAGNEDRIQVWLRRAGRYFPYIEKKIAEKGLPADLKYIAVSKTALDPAYRSSAAAGMWQLDQYSAQKYGLRVDAEFDERLDFEKSTDAALNRLADLRNTFGQWALALAAHYCGEACVAEAVKEQEIRDFYHLEFNEATEDSVLRLAAVKLVLEAPRSYGIPWDPQKAYRPLETEKVKVNLLAPVHITAAAKAAGTDYKVIKELNPQILGVELPKGEYEIKVPADKAEAMKAFLQK